ncbi:DUF1801 domain-containing protein [Myxococcota bacterium]|jgi:uncharacterized protein YdhG (YjbR/CyaY superfamily)|nr:DUF1801 domain-containing protein [Myxococcota bacterium]MBU1412389.1 DUF1801 domain-containing protein [Myxococcota bacterium]MBU1509333.1 DUF1801 domain-containing protein [Myxococcota bacterium]PKN23443.1 MAG: hypothetical protein CVU65_14025 [Deltaproteobacteria bacterium HGW-Deltaproteobacteria-22]
MRSEKSRAPEVDAYIAAFPPEVRARLSVVRDLIRSLVPEATEVISYGIPTFDLHGHLVHFAGYARHIGFYPTSSGIEHFRDRLTGYKSARGSVQFSHDEPLPVDLIREIVLFRKTENQDKSSQKQSHSAPQR